MGPSLDSLGTTYTVHPALQFRSVPGTWDTDQTGVQGRVSSSETGVVNGTERAKLLCLEHALRPVSRHELIDVLVERTELSRSVAEQYVQRLISSSLLVPTDDEEIETLRKWMQMGWGHSLHYHLETRSGTESVGRDEGGECRNSTEEDVESRGLPAPEPLPDEPIEDVMLSRRTCRNFDSSRISESELANVLGHGSAPLDSTGTGSVVAASSPAESVFDVYPVVLRGTDVERGVYRYDSQNHELQVVERFEAPPKELDRRIENMLVKQSHAVGAGFALLFVTNYRQARAHFDSSRQLRDAYVGLSMYAHRHLLVGTALGLGTFQTAAHHDRMAKSLLSIESHDEHPEYALAFGGVNDE